MKAVELHYEISGPEGAPVVLLGGSLGTTGAMWDAQVKTLSARMRTVAFDHRGHGSSPVPTGPYTIADLGGDVVALIDRLGLERVSYVGLSIGGMVGQWLAANHPERVDRLVLIATSAYLGAPDSWHERAADVRRAGTTEIVADAVLSRWFTPRWAASHRQIVAELREMIAAIPAEGYAGCCEAISALDLRPQLERITARTLVIGGSDDPSIPPEHQRALADAIAGARLEIIDDAAHLLNVQHPETVNGLLAEHLGGYDVSNPDGGAAISGERYERGMRVRREVLGDAYVDRATGSTTPFTAPFQEFITEYAWGTVWSRDVIDRRSRSMITLAALTALGQEHEIEMHVRAALANGLTPQEIGEVLLHTALYAGLPAANRAFAIAQRIIDER